MTAWLRRIFRSESKAEARQAFSELARELDGRAEKALQTLEAGLEDAIAVLALPAKYRRRLRTTNIVDRLIEEIRRRERVIRIFPNSASAHRLIGALLQEQHEEWLTGRGTSNGNRAAGHHPARPPPSSTPHNVVLNTHDIADGFLQQNWGLIGR
jgi:transposase-like protein